MQAARLLVVARAVELGGALRRGGARAAALASDAAMLLRAACSVTVPKKQPKAQQRLLTAEPRPLETVAEQLAVVAAIAVGWLAAALPTPAAAAEALAGRAPQVLLEAPAAFLAQPRSSLGRAAQAAFEQAVAVIAAVTHAVTAPPPASTAGTKPLASMVEHCLKAACAVLSAGRQRFGLQAAAQQPQQRLGQQAPASESQVAGSTALAQGAELAAAAVLTPGAKQMFGPLVLAAVTGLTDSAFLVVLPACRHGTRSRGFCPGRLHRSGAAGQLAPGCQGCAAERLQPADWAAAKGAHGAPAVSAALCGGAGPSLVKPVASAMQMSSVCSVAATRMCTQVVTPYHVFTRVWSASQDFSRIERALASPVVQQPHELPAGVLPAHWKQKLWSAAASVEVSCGLQTLMDRILDAFRQMLTFVNLLQGAETKNRPNRNRRRRGKQ